MTSYVDDNYGDYLYTDARLDFIDAALTKRTYSSTYVLIMRVVDALISLRMLLHKCNDSCNTSGHVSLISPPVFIYLELFVSSCTVHVIGGLVKLPATYVLRGHGPMLSDSSVCDGKIMTHNI